MKKKIKPENSKNEKYIQLELQFDEEAKEEELKKQKKRECNKRYYEKHKVQILENNAAYYQANKVKILENNAAYYQAHKKEKAAWGVEYRAANKERLAEYKAAYRASNRERLTAKAAEWYKANKEQLAVKRTEYYQANKEQLLAKAAEWYQVNKGKIAEYHKTPKGRASDLAKNYKQDDKNKGFNVSKNISTDYILKHIFTQPCYYCGNPNWQDMGADRIDNSKPHTPDNVLPCCFKCNCVRSDNFTVEEFKSFVDEQKQLYPNDFKFEA